MRKSSKIVHSLIEKLKQIRDKIFVVNYSAELKDLFTRQQLKNNVTRIKYYTLFTVIIYSIIKIIQSVHKGYFIYLSVLSYIHMIICILVVFLSSYFSKKDKHSFVWFICYLFIVSIYVSHGLSMTFHSPDIYIYVFSLTLFMNMFIPDIKPKVFISMSALYFIAAAGILVYKYSLNNVLDDLLSIFYVFPLY